jgi:uncharacterized protein YlzI (FlbEa/FlbD family)
MKHMDEQEKIETIRIRLPEVLVKMLRERAAVEETSLDFVVEKALEYVMTQS